MPDLDINPAALAASRRELLCELKEQEWTMWLHNPITAAFLQFQDDQIAHWRELAADVLEAGHFRADPQNEDQNLDVVRGKLLAMRGLRGITLERIQDFYGQEPQAAEEPAEGT